MIGATQDITEKRLLENELVRERQTKQREITEAVLTAQENERATVGRELHDNLGQIMIVAKLYAQMAKKYEKYTETYLEQSCELIVNAITGIRKISKTLIIPDKNIIGLIDSIENLLHDLNAEARLYLNFKMMELRKKTSMKSYR
jgi:signal transduction histidine kinase